MAIILDGTQGIDLPGENSAYLIGSQTFSVAQASTSGTSILFSSIPSWVRRISVILSDVSMSGTDLFLVQLGTASGITTSGYASSSAAVSSTQASSSSTIGFVMRNGVAAARYCAVMTIVNISDTTWVSTHSGQREAGAAVVGGGTVTLDNTLTQLRIIPTGSNTFDAGSINIAYE